MVNKMLTCYQNYRIVRDDGRYADIIKDLDDLEEAIEVVKKIYREDRGHHYTVECWDNFYDDDEYIDCEFNSIVWDSNTILPWEEII